MAARGTAEAFEKVLSVLRGIAGPPYWTNLENRVYAAAWTPEDQKFPLPFVTAVLVESPGAYNYSEDGDHLEHIWSVRISIFAPETSGDITDRQDCRSLLKLHDDVLLAFLLNPTLDGTAYFTRLRPGPSRLAGIPELFYGEQMIDLEITQTLSVEGLQSH